jgi:general secretion pathway protein C
MHSGRAPEPAKSAEPPKQAPKGGGVPPEIASKIQKTGEREFVMERSAIDIILERQAELFKLRILPEKNGETTVGVKVSGIKPDSLPAMLGLENGDTLKSINGFDVANPEKALEAYTRLRTADHLTLALNRNGKALNIDMSIR